MHIKPLESLPHRYPFVMMDSAQIVSEGKHARGIKQISINDPVVRPDGIMPHACVLEAMAQISGIASGIKRSSKLAALTDIHFSGTVAAGDTLEIESILERGFGALYTFRCTASVSGKIIAAGGIILHFNEIH